MSLSFAALGVPSNLVEHLKQRGIFEAFPIQEAALPDALAGRDVVGKAITGSGKTLAFGLPLMARLTKARPRKPVALVAEWPLIRSVRLGHSFVERVTAPSVLSLPVVAGQSLGEVRVYQDGRLVGSRALVAAAAAKRPGLTGRVGWYAGRTVHHLWGWVS